MGFHFFHYFHLLSSELGIRCGNDYSGGNENRKSQGKNIFRGEKFDRHTFFSMKIKVTGLRLQIDGSKVIFIYEF